MKLYSTMSSGTLVLYETSLMVYGVHTFSSHFKDHYRIVIRDNNASILALYRRNISFCDATMDRGRVSELEPFAPNVSA